MVELPLGPRQHVAAVLDEGLRHELGSGQPKAARKRHFVLVDVRVGRIYLAEDVGLLELVVVPVVLEEDGSARLKRAEALDASTQIEAALPTLQVTRSRHLTVVSLNAMSQSYIDDFF